jgi:hypothetical protein
LSPPLPVVPIVITVAVASLLPVVATTFFQSSIFAGNSGIIGTIPTNTERRITVASLPPVVATSFF